MFSDQMLVRGKVVMPCANDKVRTLKASIFGLAAVSAMCGPASSPVQTRHQLRAEDRHQPDQVRQSSEQIRAWLSFNESMLGCC